MQTTKLILFSRLLFSSRLLLFTLTVTLLLMGCGHSAEIQKLEEELSQVKTELTALQTASSKSLVHIVYFPLNQETTGADISNLVKQIKTLEAIEVVKDLEVGTFEDLGDKRALEQYKVVMQMRFDSQAAYQSYQKHPIHLKLRENCRTYLSGPPATYDYWTE